MPLVEREAAGGVVTAGTKLCGIFEHTAESIRNASQPFSCGVEDEKRLFISASTCQFPARKRTGEAPLRESAAAGRRASIGG
jgi:hypothetical protein